MEGKDKIQNASRNIIAAYDDALKAIIEVVKANGGLIKTPAVPSSRPTLYAYYEDYSGMVDKVAIHGIRWDDELGLTFCTDEMLENYQFDKGYYFEYFYDFVEGDDRQHLENALNDPAYFVEMDKYDLVRDETIKSIISGLDYYLG
jgi:hypothetical protein